MIDSKYKKSYIKALTAHFESLGGDVSELASAIRAKMDATSDPYSEKAAAYDVIAENSPIRLFRGFPFFFICDSGRLRRSWGVGSRLANQMLERHAGEWYYPEYFDEVKKYTDKTQFYTYCPVSFDHHTLSYERILRLGYGGIRDEIDAALAESDEGRNFLVAAREGCDAMFKFGERFRCEAERLAEVEPIKRYADEYRAIADVASRIPRGPAVTFRDAVNAIIFAREVTGDLEAFGVSTLGHLDRLLYPYYRADIESGRLTRRQANAQAKRLLEALLIYIELRFAKDTARYETSTTIYLGGCDVDGSVVCNSITKILLDLFREGRYFGVKLIVRTSSEHPKSLYDMLSRLVLAGTNNLVVQNDDTIIKAHLRQGKALEDARRYVGGGCHEIVLGGCEVHSRAFAWSNLPAMMLEAMGDKEYCSYDEFESAVLGKIKLMHDDIASIMTKYERDWSRYCPAPLLSAAIEDCVKNRRDLTAGGTRYNSVSISMSGIATLIDSMYTVKEGVFGDARFTTYAELMAALEVNFEGYEVLRRKILALPKFGGANRLDVSFADRILDGLSKCAGQENGRGGRFIPAIYPHDRYVMFGQGIGATPDGRLKGEVTSRGVSPSESTTAQLTDALGMLETLDLTRFDESVVLDANLPCGMTEEWVVPALLTAFLKCGGSSIQFNLVDLDKLIEERDNPGSHPEIVVRVCGYSEKFSCLHRDFQNEFIERSIRT